MMSPETAYQIIKKRERDRNARLRETALKKSYDYSSMKKRLKEQRDIALSKLRLKQESFKDKKTKQVSLFE